MTYILDSSLVRLVLRFAVMAFLSLGLGRNAEDMRTMQKMPYLPTCLIKYAYYVVLASMLKYLSNL
ncbi:hypothetical protein F5Y11DRAFT_319946, partial [Daldinia sp. FL1419]